MAIQKFDELNKFRDTATKWFDAMDISEEDKRRRVELSLDYCEIIIMLFEMIDNGVNKEKCLAFTEERLKIIAENYIGGDDVAYINDWSQDKANQIIDVTYRNIENADDTRLSMDIGDTHIDMPSEDYWLSGIRGILIGIECAGAVSNYYELYDALNRGMTNKVWITEADERVRKTHEEVDHVDIPIRDLFVVGNSYLLFPGDVQNGASEQEVANCRCHCEYYKK